MTTLAAQLQQEQLKTSLMPTEFVEMRTGCVFMTPEGKFVRLGKAQGHGGPQLDIMFYDDMTDATFLANPFVPENQYRVLLNQFNCVPKKIERVVNMRFVEESFDETIDGPTDRV